MDTMKEAFTKSEREKFLDQKLKKAYAYIEQLERKIEALEGGECAETERYVFEHGTPYIGVNESGAV